MEMIRDWAQEQACKNNCPDTLQLKVYRRWPAGRLELLFLRLTFDTGPQYITMKKLLVRTVKQGPQDLNSATRIYIWGGFEGGNYKGEQPIIIKELAAVKVTAVAVGRAHILFLSSEGYMFSYGDGRDGQLGLGTLILKTNAPHLIRDIDHMREIACGSDHSVALSWDGYVYTWGAGNLIGEGKGPDRTRPGQLTTFPERNQKFRAIASRYSATIAASIHDDIFLWGYSFHYQYFGYPSKCISTEQADNILGIKQIVIGKSFSLFLSDTGEVFVWGDGTYAERCNTKESLRKDTRLKALEKITAAGIDGSRLPAISQLAAGARHALLLAEDGRIWAFGDNLAGQCGIPVEDARQVVPKRIKLSSDNYHALHVSCGTQHSGCITSKHQLYLWGNSSGHKLIFTHIQDKILSQDELPGVSIRSGNKSRCMNAMLVYNLLHEMVSSFCLGDDCTIVITGNGVLQENKRTR